MLQTKVILKSILFYILFRDIFPFARVNITSAEEMLLLESYYSMYLAGVPEDLTVPGDQRTRTQTPFAGCVRDVVIETAVTHFNAIPYTTAGIELGKCPQPTQQVRKGYGQ